ncbi:MAG: hypothetical protein JWM52_765 [Candidatus Saccharibacteria bacterium]|nr:hypothetical protein [Candidatus Saccharibacteria bacterium]
MWQNFSRKFVEKKAWMGLVLPLWVLASFFVVQIVLYLILHGLNNAGAPISSVNSSILSTVTGATIYVLTITMVIGLPWLIAKYRTSKADLGINKFPVWLDFLLAPAGLLIYFILSGILIVIASHVLTFVNFNEAQSTGFEQIYQNYEYVLAFITLVVLAPIAEEILFRGYLFGKLRKHLPLWLAILVTSLLFAFVHGAWNVGIDVFALSIVLCLLRVVSKSIWPSIMLHMLKNSIAFYFLFINPTLLSTLGG